MTQSTEQDSRADFEAHWLKTRGSKKAARELERRQDEPMVYRCDSANRHLVTWQAARRAQVVPVGMALVPLIPTKQQLSVAQGYGLTRHQLRGIYAAFTAAAPQPPEAGLMSEKRTTKPESATVQMPELLRKLRISAKRDGELGRDSARTDEIEQQVRQLLADHGVK